MPTKLKDGRYWARIRLGDRKQHSLGVFASKEEAARVEMFAANEAVQEPILDDRTLHGFGTKWLDRRGLAGVRGIRTDRSRWRTHVVGTPLRAFRCTPLFMSIVG